MFSSVLLFFEFNPGEIMFIALVALLLFGGDKLPELARGLGKGIRDFKDASEGVKREITNQIDNFEAKKSEQANTAVSTETPVAEPEVTVTEPPHNTVPVAEIGATAAVEPVGPEVHATEPPHLKETPIEPLTGDAEKAAHDEYKS